MKNILYISLSVYALTALAVHADSSPNVKPTVVPAAITKTPPKVDPYKFPTRVDNYPGSNNSWPICKGQIERMPFCVQDGDSLRVNWRNYRVAELDTPELRQPKCPAEKTLAEQAREQTQKLLNGAQTVQFTVFMNPLTKEEARDKYGRILAKVQVKDENGQLVDIAEVLKTLNLARPYDGGTKSNWCV